MPLTDGTVFLKLHSPRLQESYLRHEQRVPDREKPGMGEVVMASIRRENLLPAMSKIVSSALFPIKPEPGYNVWRDDPQVFDQFPEFEEQFARSQSRLETQQIQAAVEQELKDLKTIQDSGAFGYVAMIGAGIISPDMLIPGLGAGIRVARGTKTVKTLSAIASGAATGTAAAGIAEVGLQVTQETRTLEESIINMAGGATLGGLLGSPTPWLEGLVPKRMGVWVKKFAKDPNDVLRFQERLPDADAVSKMTPQEHVQAVKDAAVSVDPDLAVIFEPGFVFGRMANTILHFPNQRLLRSESATARVASLAMADSALVTLSEAERVALGNIAESGLKHRVGEASSVFKQLKDGFWSKYVRRMSNESRDEMVPFTGHDNTEGEYVRGWKDLVWRAYINEGQLDEGLVRHEATKTSVEQAARYLRKHLGEPWQARVLDSGHITYPSRVAADKWYMTRVWNHEKIISRPDEFVDDMSERMFERAQKEGEPLTLEQAREAVTKQRDAIQDGQYVTSNRLNQPVTDLNLVPEFRERTWLMRSEDMERWLVTDYEQIIGKNLQSMMPHVELAQAFNRLDIRGGAGFKGNMDLFGRTKSEGQWARIEEAKARLKKGDRDFALEVLKVTGDLRAYAALKASPDPEVKKLADELVRLRKEQGALQPKVDPQTDLEKATGIRRLSRVEGQISASQRLSEVDKRINTIYRRAKKIDGGVKKLESLSKTPAVALRQLDRAIDRARAAEAWRNSTLGGGQGDGLHGVMGHVIFELEGRVNKKFPEGRARGGATKGNRSTKDDLLLLRDRLLGQDYSGDPTKFWAQAGRIMRSINYMRFMGGVVLTSAPDIAMGMYVNGFTPYMKGLIHFVRDPLLRVARDKEELAHFLFSTQTAHALHMARTSQLAELELNGIPASGRLDGVERSVNFVSDRVYTPLIFINRWNGVLQTIAGLSTLQRVVRDLPKLISGNIANHKAVALAGIGIDKRNAELIKKLIDTFGETERKFGVTFTWAKTQTWTDEETLRKIGVSLTQARSARDTLVQGIMREVRRTIIEPGISDKPTVMSSSIGRLALQFRSFGIAASQRVAARGWQRLRTGDLNVLSGAMLMVGMGHLVHVSSELIKGRNPYEDESMSFARFVMEAVDRGGGLGFLTELFPVFERAADTVSDGAFSDWIGGQPMSRYRSKTFSDLITGPTGGTADEMVRLGTAAGKAAFTDERMTGTDVRRGRRLFPGQNIIWPIPGLFGIRNLFDIVEKGIVDVFDLPPDRRSGVRF